VALEQVAAASVGEPSPDAPAPRDPARTTDRARRAWRVLVPASLAAALLVTVLLLRLRPARAVEARDSVVAVLPFSYDGNAGSAYLGQGIMRLLSADLNGAGRLRTVDPRALLSAVERERLQPGDVDGARALSARFGAGLAVQGQIVEAGGCGSRPRCRRARRAAARSWSRGRRTGCSARRLAAFGAASRTRSD
jgi:hypothetical protein